jgi:quercetin dioxygenase-like cupin family protein
MVRKMLKKITWDDVPSEEVAPGMQRKIVSGEKLMIAKMKFRDGFRVPLHSHENEQITHVICGTIRLWFGENKEQQMDLHAGEMVVIPPHLPHEALMIGAVEEIDHWAPPRQDWLDGTDHYLRK